MSDPLTLASITAILQPHNDKLVAEGRANKLEQENARLRAALYTAMEYLEDRVDVVDGDYGVPAPNDAMQALSAIKLAMGERP